MNDSSNEKLARRGRTGMRDSWLSRSGLMTAVILAVLLAGLASLRLVHVKTKMNQLTAFTVSQDSTPVVRPGNRDLVRLNRSLLAPSLTPEFLSATLAPGLGMRMLQMSITVPNHDETPLLLATPPDQIATAGKAVLGANFVVDVGTREGARWSTPVNILANRISETVANNAMPDGGEATAVFPATAPAGDQSAAASMGVETSITANMSGRAVEISMTARNRSDSPRSVALAWEPRFLAPESGLGRMTIVPPMSDADHDSKGEAHGATPIHLGSHDVNMDLTGLRRSYLSNGPELQLRNEEDSFVLHITALSPSIRSLRIQAGQTEKSVLIRFSTAAGNGQDDARTVLQPGATLQWRVRMEVTAMPTYPQPLQ